MNKNIISKLSYVVCGAANAACGQILKGLIFLGIEISYIVFMIVSGFERLKGLATLGDNVQGMAFNEELGIYEMSAGDNSMLILLSGVVTVVITIAFILFWLFSILVFKCSSSWTWCVYSNATYIYDSHGIY